jgi:hypothetical protein
MGGNTTIASKSPMLGALRIQQSSYGGTVALVYGRTRVSGNLVWYGDFKAVPHTTKASSGKGGGGVTQTQTDYTYEAAVVMAVGEGTITGVPSAWRGKERYTSIPGGASALSQLGLALATGTLGQATWGYLTTNHPTEALGYSGCAYVFAANYQLSDTAEVHNHSFEVDGKLQVGGGIVDADASQFIPDALTSTQYGVGFDPARIDDLSWYGSYVRALGLFLSPALVEQRDAREWVKDWCDMTNAAPVWSEGKLKIIPRGDTAASGNGASFVPNTTPVYDLTDDDFIAPEGEDPVKVERKSPADAYNVVTIEYLDRDNQYNVSTATASDLRSIELYGERAAETRQMHAIVDAAVAGRVAYLLLQRHLYVRRTYKFSLGWRYSRLEAMDLVTIPDPVTGVGRVPVLIQKTSDSELGAIDIEAEDWSLGVASAARYEHERGSGFSHDYNAEPGNVETPVFFEAPVSLTTTGLEVYAAVSGAGAAWGGCRVWASLDGDSYREVGVVKGGTRYGALTATLAAAPGGSAAVLLAGQGGQILSGSADDAATLQTLCWVGNETGGEYFAFTGATLTGANAYTLTGLVRGAYGTAAPSRAAGAQFARVDEAIAKSGPLDIDLVGRPIFFKFTSFNVYGGGEQSLADVQEYSYYITGSMLKLPPADVTDLQFRTEQFGVTIFWPPIADPDVADYHVRIDGTSWDDSTFLAYAGGTSLPWEVQLRGGRNVWVKARDVYGYESVNAAQVLVDVAIPETSEISAGLAGTDLELIWQPVTGAFAIDHYELRYGDTWAAGVFVDRKYTNTHRQRANWGGMRRWWVAAVDVAGNVGAPVSVDVTITVPGSATSRRAEVIDNNVLLYWSAPTTGSLPVERYDVRKGTTWAAGTVVGSNGNSTFTTVFEQVAGTYTYWLAPVDTAGNIGAPASIVATVNQPPDYVLRNNFDSAFAGTKTNMFVENGALIGPVTSEQWSAHFSGRSWSTIADQVAAGYTLYAEPSTTSGTYQETIDYGASVPATMVTVTLASQVLAGAVTVACQLAYKLNVGDAWTDATAGTTAFVTTAFRYLRITLTFTCSAGANLIECDGLNIKLANKLKTDSGSATAAAADSGGTTVSFGQTFVDVSSIVATPRGTAARFALVNFVDAPNPTTFKVLLFDTAGTRVSGDFDWTARGY